MEKITVSIVKRIQEGNEEVPIVNVLPPDSFIKEHIPGSINVPLQPEEDFVQRMETILTSKNHKVIVYCASKSCTDSETAAKKLDEANFSQVLDFEEGLQGWKDAGEKTESTI